MEEKDLNQAIEALRREAEKKLAEKIANPQTIDTKDISNLVHELEVHQIELEMQNDELQRVQLELHDSRDRYLNLYEYAPIGYFTLDQDGQISEVNMTGAVMLGKPKDSLLKTSLTHFIQADAQDVFYFHLRKVFETNQRQTCEIRMKKRDGAIFNAMVSGISIADKSHKPNQCLTTIIDVTVEKQSAALAESEKKYRQLVENLQEGILLYDSSNIITFVNQRVADMLGYMVKEMRGLHIFSLMDEPGIESAKRYLERRQQGIQETHDFELIRKDGTRLYTLMEAVPILDASGVYRGATVCITDITQRKQMEEALRKSEEQFRKMFEEHQSIMLLIEPATGHIVDANPASCEFYGYPCETLKHMKISDINQLPLDQVAENRRKALNKETPRFIFPHKLASGEIRTVEVHSSPITYAGQKSLFSIIHDITEQRNIEKALAQAKDDLEIKVSERTADLKLSNEQLSGEIFERLEVERSLELHNSILSLFWKISSQKEYLDRVVEVLHYWTGCRGVGLRALDEAGNIPYISYRGFTPEFIKSESGLSLYRDQCACTRIIGNNIEPQDKDMVTPGKSFYCPDTFKFVAGLTAEEKTRYRGICIQTGYQTVVVLPIKHNQKILGAIHLADERPSAISLKEVSVIESVASLIGQGIYRFQMEELLKSNQATLMEANRIARIGNWSWDIKTGETTWSDLVYQLFNLSPEKYSPSYETFLSLIDPDDRELVKKSVEEAIKGRKPFDIECRMILPDGSTRIVHELGEIKYDELGSPLKMIGTIQDITESKQAEAQLKHYVGEVIRAQEKERKRIARELHDDTSPTLASLTLELDAIVRKYKEIPPEAIQRLKQFREKITGTQQEIRQFSHELHPSVLENLGLEAALETLTAEINNHEKVRVQLNVSGSEADLSDEANLAFFRIAQEALNNTQKHSGATEAAVSLKYLRHKVRLAIRDNGRGFDLEKENESAIKRGSLGLIGMKERTHLIGANLSIKSALGKGTTVNLELSL